MSADKKHYFVIVNYNSGENIIHCLDSIFYSKNIIPRIVVVDNASRDTSLENCKKRFPKATYIYNTHNTGFAAGANIGLRWALERGADTITLCNPDVILNENCAQTLTHTICSKQADIVSPIIYSPDSDIWFSGGKISFLKMHATHTTRPLSKINCKTDYISGCVMTVSPKVFEKIGLFDENFFLYYEDADFSLRAKKAGFKLCVNPRAKAIHKEISEQNKEQKTYFLVFSGLLFFKKHTHGLFKLWFYVHLTLRKIKNYFDRKKQKYLSLQVYNAYKDYDSKR